MRTPESDPHGPVLCAEHFCHDSTEIVSAQPIVP